MGYKGPSAEAISRYQGKDRNYSNKQDNYFNLFPFTTHKQCPEVYPGCFIKVASGCDIQEKQTPENLYSEVVALIEDDLYEDSKDATLEILQEITAVSGSSKTSNLRIALSAEGSNNANKMASYLVSMAGDRKALRDIAKHAVKRSDDDANVVERLIYAVVPILDNEEADEKQYFRVSEALSTVFLKDLEFILSDSRLIEMYLSPLLDFYFFMMIAQNSLLVSRKMSGKRSDLEELYFALDWEKTNQTRACYKHGFKKLERSLEEMFVHAGVLEILNTVDDQDSNTQIDYIGIRELIENAPATEESIARNIRNATVEIRSYKYDPDLFSDTPLDDVPVLSVEKEIDYLFDTIKSILFKTTRNKPRCDYSNSFRLFCQSGLCFEKRRGRSGTLLNITDSTLLLLTTLAIGEHPNISLTDLFKQFRIRGVLLDEPSKELVAAYFEKRSMLDKKSDSGETQYVKRVL